MSEHVELTVKLDYFAPWDERPEVQAFDSPHPVDPVWNEQTDEQREAMLYLVRDGLFELIQNCAEWVPTSFRALDQERLDVHIVFDLSVVDSYVLNQQLNGDREFNRVLARVAAMQDRYDEK